MKAAGAIWVISGLCLVAVPSYPTLVVAIKTPEGYVIGTDSLRSSVNGSTRTICKIRIDHDVALLDWGYLGQSEDNTRGWIGLTAPFLSEPVGSARDRRERLLSQINSFEAFNSLVSQMQSMAVGAAFVGHDGFYGFTAELSDREHPQNGYHTDRFDNPPYRAFGTNDDKAMEFLQRGSGMLQTPLPQALELAKKALDEGMREEPHSVHSPFTIVLVPNAKGKVQMLQAGACK